MIKMLARPKNIKWNNMKRIFLLFLGVEYRCTSFDTREFVNVCWFEKLKQVFRPSWANLIIVALNPRKYLYNNSYKIANYSSILIIKTILFGNAGL